MNEYYSDPNNYYQNNNNNQNNGGGLGIGGIFLLPVLYYLLTAFYYTVLTILIPFIIPMWLGYNLGEEIQKSRIVNYIIAIVFAFIAFRIYVYLFKLIRNMTKIKLGSMYLFTIYLANFLLLKYLCTIYPKDKDINITYQKYLNIYDFLIEILKAVINNFYWN